MHSYANQSATDGHSLVAYYLSSKRPNGQDKKIRWIGNLHIARIIQSGQSLGSVEIIYPYLISRLLNLPEPSGHVLQECRNMRVKLGQFY